MDIGQQEFVRQIASLLGWFHACCAVLNAGAAARSLWRGRRRRGLVWSGFALLFAVAAGSAFGGMPWGLPEAVKDFCDWILGPVSLTLGSMGLLTVFFLGRRFFVRSEVAWSVLNASLLFLGLSLTDPQFAALVGKPDNVPIVAMVYLLGFFVWWGAAQAVENDDRRRAGQGPVEGDYRQTVLVWPDLVYIELICMVILTVFLVVWSLVLRAPLEGPANPVVTPNPSKAPWYFLGLQEMLVYFDPAIAGVLIPLVITFGLCAIPYLDRSEESSGYYTIDERKFGYVVFQFGFLQLWVLLILIGTFMRGPNWTFFGLYEPHDPHKLMPLTNITLSEYFWGVWLGRELPEVPAAGGFLVRAAAICWREIAGIAFCLAYFVGGPLVLSRTWLARLRGEMGRARYWVMSVMLLLMLYLPLKMVLRWTLNLSQVVSIPEYFLNF